MIAMGKSILGVDIGYNSLKLALVKDGRVKKAVIGSPAMDQFGEFGKMEHAEILMGFL